MPTKVLLYFCSIPSRSNLQSHAIASVSLDPLPETGLVYKLYAVLQLRLPLAAFIIVDLQIAIASDSDLPVFYITSATHRSIFALFSGVSSSFGSPYGMSILLFPRHNLSITNHAAPLTTPPHLSRQHTWLMYPQCPLVF